MISFPYTMSITLLPRRERKSFEDVWDYPVANTKGLSSLTRTEKKKKKKQKFLDVLTLLTEIHCRGSSGRKFTAVLVYYKNIKKNHTAHNPRPVASIFSLSFPIAVRVDGVANGSSNNAAENRFGSFVVSRFSAPLFPVITSSLDRPTPFSAGSFSRLFSPFFFFFFRLLLHPILSPLKWLSFLCRCRINDISRTLIERRHRFTSRVKKK